MNRSPVNYLPNMVYWPYGPYRAFHDEAEILRDFNKKTPKKFLKYW